MIISVFYIKIADMIYIVKITENKFTENAFYSEIASNIFYHLQTTYLKKKIRLPGMYKSIHPSLTLRVS